MGVDEGNLQVNICRSNNGKASNSIPPRYIPVVLMVFVIHTISYICDSMSKR